MRRTGRKCRLAPSQRAKKFTYMVVAIAILQNATKGKIMPRGKKKTTEQKAQEWLNKTNKILLQEWFVHGELHGVDMFVAEANILDDVGGLSPREYAACFAKENNLMKIKKGVA